MKYITTANKQKSRTNQTDVLRLVRADAINNVMLTVSVASDCLKKGWRNGQHELLRIHAVTIQSS